MIERRRREYSQEDRRRCCVGRVAVELVVNITSRGGGIRHLCSLLSYERNGGLVWDFDGRPALSILYVVMHLLIVKWQSNGLGMQCTVESY